MPTLIKLPTRRKEENPVLRAVTPPRVASVKSREAQATAPVVKSPAVLPTNGTTHPVAPKEGKVTSGRMRARDLELLQTMSTRIEVLAVRGKAAKPVIYITKGEFDALAVGLEILAATVKTKKV